MTFVAENPADVHHDLPGHPENAARTRVILDALRTDPELERIDFLRPDRLLSREEALAVHTPRVWLNIENHESESAMLDPDTYMVPGSRTAALGTARLGMLAVERAVRDGESGFVAARPPGHHATRDRSMGFCLLNNVAIAAVHAATLGAKRVLVFDHDVHHGNGTQDVFFDSAQVLYQSFHLSPHYPGTGQVDEIGSGAGRGFTMNAPLSLGDGEEEVRSLMENVFVPAARAHRPDLILLSSGFDSLEGDPLGGLRLREAFFGEIAARLRVVCPRVVAFLEGGYQLDRIGPAARALVRGLHGGSVTMGDAQRAPRSQAELVDALSPFWPILEG